MNETQRAYNREYYLRNKERLIKQNAIYQKIPANIEKRKERNRKRYIENDKGFRDKNLKSHDRLKLIPEWRKHKNLVISVWGMTKRTDNIERAKIYYSKNKERIKEQKKNANSQRVKQALERINRDISIKEAKKDIQILKAEIKAIKSRRLEIS